MKKIILSNDLHNTTATVQMTEDGFVANKSLSRARKKLCGIKDCHCSMDDGGCRPAQLVTNMPDGSWIMTTRFHNMHCREGKELYFLVSREPIYDGYRGRIMTKDQFKNMFPDSDAADTPEGMEGIENMVLSEEMSE
ncbi:MAG: hypothetical protein SVK08_00250 [Halobacteriota archaeon]|nr:hypothetical protein [Halobacteriota archaeon]